jgi:hypothetical protein
VNAPLQRLRAELRFDRHAYAVELDAGRLRDLRRTILAAAPRVLAELDAFDAFLAPAAFGDD